MGSANSLKQKYVAPGTTNVTPLRLSTSNASSQLDQVGDTKRRSGRISTTSRGQSSPDAVSLESEALQKWHKGHCSDTDFGQATCIRDAFEFDASNIEVSKRERVWSMSDGRRRDYGTVRIARGYPSKIDCVVCGAFIVDRNGKNLFFFCWRCRRAGRSLQMCAVCYEDGALGDGPRHLRGPSVQRMGSTMSMQRTSSIRSSVGPMRSTSPKMSQVSIRSSTSAQQTLNPGIPSGTWKGWIIEGRNRRVVKRDLSFFTGGGLTGSGDEGCTLEGSWRRGLGYHHVSWVETYEWGQLEATVQLAIERPDAAHLEGEFSASDGGKGTLNLTFS